jgi:hypothetical protein
MSPEPNPDTPYAGPPAPTIGLMLVLGWLWVGVPLGWGVWQTIRTSLALFR